MIKDKNNIFLKGREIETVVQITKARTLQTLAGVDSKNLRLMEKLLQISINLHADGLNIAGLDADVALCVELIQQLSELIQKGEQLFEGDIERAFHILAKDKQAKLADVFRDYIKVAGRKQVVAPKTKTQKIYIDAIRSKDVVFGIGPAGTGKTYLAMAMGLSALLNKEVKKLILCRPAVEAGEKLGFLPGDMAEKVNPYLRPLYDALYDMVEYNKAKELLECEAIEVAPLAFMRGRTLSNAFIILDEGQNTSKGQMKMFLTRLGMESKCVVTGDLTQIDLPNGMSSGLVNAVEILKNVEGIEVVNFSENDVIRHPLVARIINAYDLVDRKGK